MKIVTIVGARPQFIKAAVVSRAIADFNRQASSNSSKITEIIVHTGQHYDRNMSDIFFEEMSIPKPDYYLDIHGLSHGAMTGQMLEKIEPVLLKEKPDVAGLTAPGMPMGSPGMEGPRKDPYDVLTFKRNGKTSVYASHNQ